MFCLDKQWIILIPVLLHFLDCSVSSHLLPSSILLNSTLTETISLSKILLIFQRWYQRCVLFICLTIVCPVAN